MGKKREVGGFKQMLIMTQRNAELIFNNKIKMGMIVFFPVIIGFLLSYVSRKNTFECAENASSSLFAITSALIYLGMFNSLTEICKERNVVKREYMTNMKLSSYISSIMIVQGVICLFQSLVVTAICYNCLKFPESDILFSGMSFLKYFISMFLITYAADGMGVLISSIVKTNELANLVAPIIILVQLVLSGVLFKLEGGVVSVVSKLTISRWGISALGRIADINSMIPRAVFEDESGVLAQYIENPGEDFYNPTSLGLLGVWGVLILFIAVFALLSMLFLRRIEKDAR
jgi:hypothetical protein